MNHIGRRAMVCLALLAFSAILAPGSIPARGAHPGANGGLTYPLKDGIRVHRIGLSSYDLDLTSATDVAWTPDGQFLAYARAHGLESGIYIADAAGCGVERLTTDRRDRAPAFDGSHLYFTRGTESLQFDYDHGAETSPVSGEPEPSGLGTDVAVSVIEGRWAHVEPPNAAHPDEWVLMLDDIFLRDETVEVFRSESRITGTEWAPDGSLLAFEARAEDGTTQIFGAEVVGDPIEVEQMTDALPGAVAPAFSPLGGDMAWFRVDANRQSGIVYVRDLATGVDTFVTQQSRFGLDWQPLHDGPDAPAVPTETETTVTLDSPTTGPGLHPFRVTVSPAPAEGEGAIVVDDAALHTVPLDGDTGIVLDAVDLETGPHVITATFLGSCPHLTSAGQLAIEVPEAEPVPAFEDIGDSPFREEIEWLVAQGITTGCAPTLFCPKGAVTRGQMASFIARGLDLPDATEDHFADDDGTSHEEDINRLAEAAISNGCAPDAFCPDRTLTRAEMASFLARALELGPATQDWFDDDDGRTHEANINRMAEAGITNGCGPRRFCSSRTVTREEMAAFLFRALS